MVYRVFYTKNALSDLSRLQKRIAKRIVDKIAFFRQQQDPLHFAKKLKNMRDAPYRFRIGNYRAFFDIDKKGRIHVLMILRIKDRKDAYND